MTFTYDKCFLCGCNLDENNETEEHIFPKWLQRKYNLWNEKLTLLNSTLIPYKQLKIPCCKTCNGKYLSDVERKVRMALDSGYEGFSRLDEKVIFQWLLKLSYGMLFKELSLKVDQSNEELGNIINPEQLDGFKLMFTFLQSVRIETEFGNVKPWSIFIFNLHSYNDDRDYDARDYIGTHNYFMRLGEVGIIAYLHDNGHQKKIYEDYFKQYQQIKLHPIQFYELCAKVLYKSTLLNRRPKSIILLPKKDNGKMEIMSNELQGLSSLPVYDDWDQEKYANILVYFWKSWNVSFENIYTGSNLVGTFLNDENGKIKVFDNIESIYKVKNI